MRRRLGHHDLVAEFVGPDALVKVCLKRRMEVGLLKGVVPLHPPPPFLLAFVDLVSGRPRATWGGSMGGMPLSLHFENIFLKTPL